MPESTEQLLTACQYLQGALMAFGMRQKDLLGLLHSQMFLGALLWGEGGMELSRRLVGQLELSCLIQGESWSAKWQSILLASLRLRWDIKLGQWRGNCRASAFFSMGFSFSWIWPLEFWSTISDLGCCLRTGAREKMRFQGRRTGKKNKHLSSSGFVWNFCLEWRDVEEHNSFLHGLYCNTDRS